MVEPTTVPTWRRAVGMLRPTRTLRPGRAWSPRLPAGRTVHVPGHGDVFVRQSTSGTGVPVLLLHGWTWTLDINYFGVMPVLSEHQPWVGLDHRGHGGGLPIGGPFSLDDCAQDVCGVLDALGIERVIVCGFSLGGPVGLTFALAHPERVAGMVLIATALNYTQTARDRMLWRMLGAAEPLTRYNIGSTVSARYFGANRTRAGDLATRWHWLRTELARTPARNVVAMGNVVRRYDLRDRVEPLRKIPSAVVVTTRDTLCRPALQYQLATQLGADVVTLPADHDVPVTNPQLFADRVLEAIERVRDNTG